MILTPPVPTTTMIAIAGGAAALAVLAYILKMRRRRHEVPFSKLWQRVLKEKEASAWWRRLRRLISLLVQLAFLALILGAALDPKIGKASVGGKNVVIVLDASASMKTVEGLDPVKTRMDLARAEAKRLLGGFGGGDAAMLIRMDAEPTTISRFESDAPQLMKLVDATVASDTPADLPRALATAADALHGREHPMIVIIGDGAYPAEALAQVSLGTAATTQPATLGRVDLTGIDVRFVPVGKETRNVGIVAFNVRRYLSNKLSYEVLVEVENFGAAPVTEKLSLYAGDDVIDVKTLQLAAGERQRQIYPDLGGGDDRVLRAQIAPTEGPPDAFPLDDTAWALLPERKKQRVLLVSADNLYLEAALLLDPNITVDKLRPAEYEAQSGSSALTGYSVTVFDGYTPTTPLASPAAIYFHPQGAASPFVVGPELKRPFITEVNPDHPLTRWVTLSDVNIDKSNVFTPGPGDVVVARSVRDPIIIAGRHDGVKLLAFGFALDGTDLPLRVAFPVLLVNALDWFAGDDAELLTTYRTGRVWSVPVDPEEKLHEIVVRGPGGTRKAPVVNGRARFFGALAGVYTLSGPDGELAVAANLADPVESNVTPAAQLVLGGQTLAAPPSFTPSLTRSIWVYLVLGALLLIAVEWVTYQRRITV